MKSNLLMPDQEKLVVLHDKLKKLTEAYAKRPVDGLEIVGFLNPTNLDLENFDDNYLILNGDYDFFADYRAWDAAYDGDVQTLFLIVRKSAKARRWIVEEILDEEDAENNNEGRITSFQTHWDDIYVTVLEEVTDVEEE